MGGISTPDEKAGWAMEPTYRQLEPVVAYMEAVTAYIRAGVEGWKFDAAGLTEGWRLGNEFDRSWPHYLPTIWELVLADRAGRLEEKIAELTERFRDELRELENG